MNDDILGENFNSPPQGEHLDPGGQLNGRKEHQLSCLPHRIFCTIKTRALSFLRPPYLRSRGLKIRSVIHRFSPGESSIVLDVSLHPLQIPGLGGIDMHRDKLLLCFLSLHHCAICHHPLSALPFADENLSFADCSPRTLYSSS